MMNTPVTTHLEPNKRAPFAPSRRPSAPPPCSGWFASFPPPEFHHQTPPPFPCYASSPPPPPPPPPLPTSPHLLSGVVLELVLRPAVVVVLLLLVVAVSAMGSAEGSTGEAAGKLDAELAPKVSCGLPNHQTWGVMGGWWQLVGWPQSRPTPTTT